MEPMLLRPVGKDYLWGGTRLKTEFHKAIDMTPLAESWECSVHPDGSNTILNGVHQGKTLAEVLQQHPDYLGSKQENGLPILIKFIDAKSDLSIQVHPDDAYARQHENQNGKTEMWYVLDALPGASLVIGFAHDVTEKQLCEAVKGNDLAKHLQRVPVCKGNVFYIPSGLVHAIGAGVLLAEIQENSNVTYRVYDYHRTDKNGDLRPLHLDKALDVMNRKASPRIERHSRLIRYYLGCSREILCRCEYFETEKIQVSKSFSFSVLETSFQVLLCIEGEGKLETESCANALYFRKGDCIFLAAGSGRCQVGGILEFLKVRC
ncbi:MAG: class I mannose-6-phosphate isomerase [Lachnospiraceae bacterium]|nr:class I mannose-6-phosphate isomerase [Lachnospiraceae bacterium]